MDPGARETKTPEGVVRQPRPCWAIKTLVEEFRALFPETPVEYSNYNQFDTALDVTFDLSMLEPVEVYDVAMMFNLLGDPATNRDPRIDVVITGGEHHEAQVLVSMRANARTQDSREPFGLADAWSVLTGEEQ